MPNRSKNRGKGKPAMNVRAWETVQQATGQMPKPATPKKKSGVSLGGHARKTR